MKTGMSTQREALATGFGDSRGLLYADQIAKTLKERWRKGEIPDLTAALAGHPELRRHRTIVLDLAYQEYSHRLQSGEDIDAERFAKRFPSFQRSLHLFIAVHGLLSCDPEGPLREDAIDWPEPGGPFLQFELIAEIGRGSFGRVFLATEPALGDRPVVVKVAPHGGEEADILGRLRHSNIVPIHSLQHDETGLTAFCMPYLGRATLCDVVDFAFLDPKPPKRASIILDALDAVTTSDLLDSAEPQRPDAVLRKGSYVDGVLYLSVQLADALAHAHGRGICHRDLKPSNVLVTPDGRPLILDFNLSVEQNLAATKIGGTIPYMAPEELVTLFDKPLEASRRPYDPRSDLFSLGVIVYELLTGVLPFGTIPRDSSLEEMAFQLHQRQRKGPIPIRERNSQVDCRLARLVESCLAFEPDQRPETAQALAVALRKELTPVRRSRRWIGNHRKLVAGTAAAVLSLILAVALFLVLRPPYSVRQLELGLACSKQGHYEEAVKHLNDAIQADPICVEAFLARGKAYQNLEEFQTAYLDYRSADQLVPSPQIKALEGYCQSRMNAFRFSIDLYQKAMKAGYRAPAVLHNNIGYSKHMLAELKDAETHFRLAVQLDGDCQVYRCNLIVVLLRSSLHGQPVPDDAFLHAAKAIEIGPPTASLYLVIANLYAHAAGEDPKWTQRAVHCVEKAIELGCPPKSFEQNGFFASLQKNRAFRDALKAGNTASASPKLIQLVEPSL